MLLSGTLVWEVSLTKLPNLLILLYLIISYLLSDEDDFALCAANEHAKCITGALQEMEKRVKMCFSAQHFIECYTSPNESCSAKICTDFVNLEKTLDSRLLEMFKESPGVMPGC